MNGKKAKACRRILREELKQPMNKHGIRMYDRDEKTGQIKAVGSRPVYQQLKKLYKSIGGV